MRRIPSFYRLLRCEETKSTNDDAKNAAEAGAGAGLVIVADRQTGGRGRRGRVWTSPEGNLYATILLRPLCPIAAAPFYGFAAALGVAEAVASLTEANHQAPEAVTLKWPNDVLAGGAKISGILMEAGAADEKGLLPWLTIGVGINVRSHPEGGLYSATSLAALGLSAGRDEVLGAFLAAFEAWRQRVEAGDLEAVRESWLRCAQKGTLRVCRENEEISGHFAGLDAQGRLILRLEGGGERVIDTGDVLLN